MPSGSAPIAEPSGSVVPRKSSWASCERITRCASRMTTGSAHAPPMKPCSWPSRVTSARAPVWPEDGA